VDERAPRPAQQVAIELREPLQAAVAARALELALGERDQCVEMAHVALLKERVDEHVEERRGERDREAMRNAVARERVQRGEERDVRLRERLEEPALLQEVAVLGM